MGPRAINSVGKCGAASRYVLRGGAATRAEERVHAALRYVGRYWPDPSRLAGHNESFVLCMNIGQGREKPGTKVCTNVHSTRASSRHDNGNVRVRVCVSGAWRNFGATATYALPKTSLVQRWLQGTGAHMSWRVRIGGLTSSQAVRIGVAEVSRPDPGGHPVGEASGSVGNGRSHGGR